MILKEYNSPSKVYDEISEEKLGTWDRDAIAFYYHPEYGFIAKPQGIHQRILRALALSIIGYEDEADYERQLKQANSNSEFFRMDDELKDAVQKLNKDGAVMGRYWCERGIISFWDGIPDLQTFKIIVKKLHVNFDDIRIALEEEIMLAKDVYQSNSICDGNGIPFDAEMQADAKALHLMNASDKVQTDQMQNYLHNRAENQGKKLQYQNKTEEMPMAQWRALHSTSESTIYNNMIITEKLTYEEKYNLSVKLIKQGYLIHCTNAEYDKFDKSCIKGGSRAMEGYGMYFSDMPYKSIEYGNNFKLIKKEDFNFLNSKHPIDKNMLFNEDIKHELYRLQIELEDCRTSQEYDSILGEIEKLEDIINHSDKDLDMLLDILIIRNNPQTYGHLDALIPNRDKYIPKLIQRYIDKGYDGYYTNGIYTVFNFDKLNEHLLNYTIEDIQENYTFDTKEDLPNTITLYHGTNIDALNEILESGIMDAKLGSKRSETYGVNWFSTDPNHKWGEVLFSIDVPQEYFEYGACPRFTLMNQVHVRTLDEIFINNFNFQVLKIGSFSMEDMQELLHNLNDDVYILRQYLMEWFGDRTNAFDWIDSPLMIYILKHVKGEDFMRQEGLIENIQYEVKPNEVDLSSFKKQRRLQPDIWGDNELINSKVRLQLLDIADDFYDSLEISFVQPDDIILRGSICNYNWSNESDIDVHIVVDFKEIGTNKDLIKDYFDTKKNEWNNNHKGLEIYGFKVELYVEDINEDNISNGVYSLESNKWIKKPDIHDVKSIKPYKDEIRYLSAQLMTCIDDIIDSFNNVQTSGQLEEVRDTLEFVWSFIKKMRKESLNKEGEYSKGNIIYKILRRNGYLEEILQLRNDIYDKLNSIS